MDKNANAIDIVGTPKMYRIATEYWSRPQFEPRGHDGIALVLEGKIEYHFADFSAVAGAGDVVVLPGNIPYSGTRLADGTTAFIVADFDCTDQTALAALALPAVIPTERFGGVRRQFADALEMYDAWQRATPFLVKSAVYRLIGDLTQACLSKTSDGTEEILKYIAAHLADPTLRVSDLCERFFISESQLRRNLKKATGMNPAAYITVLRLERAAAELRWSDRAVKDIAVSAGFVDPYYFSNCFTRRFSISPTAYRKRYHKFLG